MASRKKRSRSKQRTPAPPSGSSGSRQRPEPDGSLKQARISGRWLLSALAWTLLAAVVCAWGVLCLLFWQGSWQLLYHPLAVVARTPASVGMAYDAVGFASTEAGTPRLAGWWIPAANGAASARFTVLFLHGQEGNLGNTVDALSRLHRAGVNVLAFDYRGYGQSQFVRPSEAHWREDAEWALQYLTETRHIDPGTIILAGAGLGANLALELAAAHPDLAGVIVEFPLTSPMDLVWDDARARLVPARLLVRDRYDLNAPAGGLRIPLLWFAWDARAGVRAQPTGPEAYERVAARKMLIWLEAGADADRQVADALTRWLGDLPAH